MRYLRRFLENEEYSVFDSQNWKKFLPKKLIVINQNGKWVLERPDENYGMGHATNITGLMNCIQINWAQNTPSREDGDVTRDGEPDQLEFDITIVKDNDGKSANPDSLKLNVDISYGDAMVSEFTIEMPNKVNIHHYTGYGSLHDPNTFFGFEDESLQDIVNFFNAWGFSLTKDNFKFLDKYHDSYINKKTNETIEINPTFSEDRILILNNSKPQENRYLDNVIGYLDQRGIKWQIASSSDEITKSIEDYNIIGAISTGSEWRIESEDGKRLIDANKKLLEVFNGPILGICFGMQAITSCLGGEVVDTGDFTHGSYVLEDVVENPLFDDMDIPTTQFMFSFHDAVKECPTGFEKISDLNGYVAAMSNGKIYGCLFHPEDTEYTHKVLDNFIAMCDGGKSEEVEDLKDEMKIKNVIERYTEFVNSRKK